MSEYSPSDRSEAVRIARQLGNAEAARRTGISPQTISRWRSRADTVDPVAVPGHEQASAGPTWAEVREREATAVGLTAMRIRARLLEMLADQVRGVELKEHAIAYAILVDKAELLSGNATERFESVGRDEVDRDFRRLLAEFESRARGD